MLKDHKLFLENEFKIIVSKGKPWRLTWDGLDLDLLDERLKDMLRTSTFNYF